MICEGLDRIKLAQDSAVVDPYECDNEPSRSVKGVQQLTGFSIKIVHHRVQIGGTEF